MTPLIDVDWWALGPGLALSGGAMLLMLLEFVPAGRNSSRGALVALASLLAAAACVWRVHEVKRALFDGMFVHDTFTVFFTLLFCGIAALSVLLSWDYVKRMRINQAEYYALLLAATLGMIVMSASNDLITIFLGLELMSLALYVLVGFRRSRLESNEAAMKYFLLGAFASGFLLYGIALLYGATGTTHLERMAAFLAGSPLLSNPLLLMGGLLVLVGLGFKVAAVPFHMWTPDAYEGAPTTVTGYMSAGAKAAGFAALLRLALVALPDLQASWKPVLIAIAALTMTVGNVTALLQTNLKRMLAYSSIAHAGYVLVAVVAGGNEGAAAAVFYLAIYSLMNLGAFGIVALLGRDQDEPVLLSDLAGLGFKNPALAFALTIFMLSLGGIPPTAGFMGKFYVFRAAVQAGQIPLVIVGVLNSVVSIFYYLRVTVALYMEEPAGEPTAVSRSIPAVIGVVVSLALTLWWGLQAHALLEQAQRSVLGLM
ncbi:MAG: NADH-quinone oxidoreductase subunit N [Candidatus Eisenbacteria bacterium]|uniref:NADH-quinone oxidoreductase subunit N n=1 Tax=Eiseniibacteriota bacterium TaxID=2212470 RepID=A0A538TJ64_UNCEI|nr:MAG: NADH-quinone oxidoreductase subunit N [Candidatus Eisenbacteria bacterium]